MKNRGICKSILGLSLLVVASNNLFINNVQALELDDSTTNDKVIEQITDKELSREEILNSVSINMEFNALEVIIKGNINQATTVEDILNNISLTNLEEQMPIKNVSIINKEGNFLNNSDIVDNSCSIVFISEQFILKYQINFWGDFNEDAVITEEDIKTGIDNYLEQQKDNEIIPEDISSVGAVIDNNTYEVETPVLEDIDVNLDYNDNKDIYVEDTFKVELKINGLINNYFNVISGNLDYDNNILKLENFYIVNNNRIIMGNIKDNKFIYLLNNYQDNDIFLVMEFSAIDGGVTNIYLNNLKLLMNGFLLNPENNDFIVTIKSNLYGKGGDYEIDNATNNNLVNVVNDVSSNKELIINKENNKDSPNEDIKDSFIKDIVINNYNINFNKDIKFYSLNVDSNVNNLDINVMLNNISDIYAITGNENFRVGKNEIIITLLSSDGSNNDYVIEVNKESPTLKDSEIDKEFSSRKSIMLVPLMSLIAVISIILYRLIRKKV